MTFANYAFVIIFVVKYIFKFSLQKFDAKYVYDLGRKIRKLKQFKVELHGRNFNRVIENVIESVFLRSILQYFNATSQY